MKKIALFGGTGRTGKHFLKQALDNGYAVKALVRDPGKLGTDHPKLEVIVGDVLNAQDVEQTVKDSDIAVSLFGHVKGSPEWLQTDGTKHIVKAMKNHGVTKIISLSGGALPFPEKDQPKVADKIIRTIFRLFFSKVLNDAIAHHQVLEQSGLDWIIVRGPRLTDDEKQGEYRVGWVGVNASTKIPRADLATFILTQIEDDQYVGTMPFVST